MRKLIYICVHGPEFHEMATYLVRSLRGVGQYTGDILIIANTITPCLTSIDGLCQIQIIPLSTIPNDHRYEAMRFISPLGYDQIANLDADIMAVADVNPIFCAQDELLYVEEPWHTLASSPEHLYSVYLTEQERYRFRNERPINDGQFVVSGSQFWSLYEAHTAAKRPDVQESGAGQSAFNALIRRGRIPARPMDPLHVANSLRVPLADWYRHRLVHFAGAEGRLNMMWAMCYA